MINEDFIVISMSNFGNSSQNFRYVSGSSSKYIYSYNTFYELENPKYKEQIIYEEYELFR